MPKPKKKTAKKVLKKAAKKARKKTPARKASGRRMPRIKYSGPIPPKPMTQGLIKLLHECMNSQDGMNKLGAREAELRAFIKTFGLTNKELTDALLAANQAAKDFRLDKSPGNERLFRKNILIISKHIEDEFFKHFLAWW